MSDVNKQVLDALKEVAQTLAWKSFGECRGFSTNLKEPHEVIELAKYAIAAAEQAQTGHCASCKIETATVRLCDNCGGKTVPAQQAAVPETAPDLAAQLRALAKQHGWNFVWSKARLIEEGTKTCHKCHNGALTHSSLCVHYDKAKEQAAMVEYRAAQKGNT